MVDKGYFEHESYNGETTGERLKRFGYEWEVFAENIARGTTASNSTPEHIFESWMESSEHKASILDETLQEVGIGAHKGTYDTYSGAIVYTVDFATPTNTSGSADAPATSEPGRTVELSDEGTPSAGTSTAGPGWCSASFDEIMVRTSRNAGDQPDTDEVRRLLNEPNFEGTTNAIDDLQKGIVDKLLIEALLTMVQKHQIYVNSFKTGHQFIAGLIDGPFIPKEYGADGSWTNTHYYGRAVDIFEVDHKAVQSNGLSENVLDVGKILASIQKEKRPDQVIGPTAWTQALQKTNADDGWLVVDEWQTRLHEDHLNIGYETETQEG